MSREPTETMQCWEPGDERKFGWRDLAAIFACYALVGLFFWLLAWPEAWS